MTDAPPMDRRRWIILTAISGKDIRSFIPLPNPSLFISVNGRYRHTAPPARTRRQNPRRKNPVWKTPVRIDLENEPDLVLEFDLMAEGDLPDVRDRDRHFGEVNVPVDDLLAGGPDGSLCHVSYQVRSRGRRPNGTLSFSYRVHQPTPPPPPRRDTCRQSESSPIYLSMEIVAAILTMLPPRALTKFRCVCRSWNYLLQHDPYFAAQHSNNSNEKSTFVSLTCTQVRKDDYAYALHYRPCDGSKVRKIGFGLVPYNYHATNSCNGLVGVYARDAFYVANPSIMKLATLPRGSPHVIKGTCSMPLAGIGFDSSTAAYKVVRLFARKYEGHRPISMGCEVFSLGGVSWKPVEDPPVPLRYTAHRSAFDDTCSVVEGAVYWKVPREVTILGLLKPEFALSFDLVEEKFSILLHPERNLRPLHSSLVAIGGSLCIVDKLTDWELINIWTLKDRRSSEWVKRYSIDLSRTCPMTIECMTPLTIDGTRLALLCNNDSIYYDLMTMRIVHRTRTDHVDLESVRPYTESIVWPFRS